MTVSEQSVDIATGWTPDPGSSLSLHADACTRQQWFEAKSARLTTLFVAERADFVGSWRAAPSGQR